MSLFERIDRAVSGAVLNEGAAAVLPNLSAVLNTRRGSAAAQPDLGTPPPSELLRGERPLVERMQRSIGEAIERYEPRLAGVRVALEPPDDQSFLLRFRVRARLVGTGEEVSFRTFVDPLGGLRVRA